MANIPAFVGRFRAELLRQKLPFLGKEDAEAYLRALYESQLLIQTEESDPDNHIDLQPIVDPELIAQIQIPILPPQLNSDERRRKKRREWIIANWKLGVTQASVLAHLNRTPQEIMRMSRRDLESLKKIGPARAELIIQRIRAWVESSPTPTPFPYK